MSEQTLSSESTRDRIVRAAIELFHTRSYTAVGVAEVCEAAAINKGSFYHYFESKEAVVLAVIDRFLADPWFRGMLIANADAPPLERIEGVFREMGRRVGTLVEANGSFPGCPIGNLVAEMSTQNEAVRMKLAETYETWSQLFEDPLREARRRGELPAGTDVKVTARALVTVMQGLALIAKAYNDPKKVQKVGRTLVRRVLGIEV